MSRVILVTSIGTVNAGAVIQELRGFCHCAKIIGADINDRSCVVNSNDVDEFYTFPCVVDSPEEYVSFLKKFCIAHEVSNIFAFIDEEIVVLSKHSADFLALGIRLCMPESHVVDICHYKDRFADWMEKNMPEYAIRRYRNMDEVQYPAFIKPIEGRASKGCRRIDNKEGLVHVVGESPFTRFVVQPFLCGDIVAADVVRIRKGNICRSMQRKELLRNSNGCGIAVEIVDNPAISSFCNAFAEKIDLEGVVNVEFLMTEEGPKVIEVNPRLPAGTSYSCMSGFHIVSYALAIANGDDVEIWEPESCQVGKRYARRYETYEM